MLRKTSAAAAIIAFATVGSALFGGAALANDGHGDEAAPPVTFTGGEGGPGGDVWQECDQEATAYNIFKGKVFDESTQTQTASASNACTATGGVGGAGGAGATFED
jgi:hypothetical protein